jgi:hypothetical protein
VAAVAVAAVAVAVAALTDQIFSEGGKKRRTSAAESLVISAQQKYVALLNVASSLVEISGIVFWSLKTLAMTVGLLLR